MRNGMFGVIVGVCAIFAGVTSSGEDVVFSEDFAKTKSLKESGWELFKGKATKFELKDGCLEMLFAQAPYKGGNIHRVLPAVTAGTFCFEIALDTNGAKYDHLSFKIDLYNITLAFKKMGARHKLMRYYNGKWKDLADNVPVGKKIKIKMIFDNSTKVVQYFVDDMESPVMIDEDVVLTPRKISEPLLLIANYGLASGDLEHKMYKIKLTK